MTFTVFLPPIADLNNVTATFNVAKGIEYLKKLSTFVFFGTQSAVNSKITTIDVSRLPKSVAVLDIRTNKINEIKGLEQHASNLTTLRCASTLTITSDQKLKGIDGYATGSSNGGRADNGTVSLVVK